jgi:hypothetical protein
MFFIELEMSNGFVLSHRRLSMRKVKRPFSVTKKIALNLLQSTSRRVSGKRCSRLTVLPTLVKGLAESVPLTVTFCLGNVRLTRVRVSWIINS